MSNLTGPQFMFILAFAQLGGGLLLAAWLRLDALRALRQQDLGAAPQPLAAARRSDEVPERQAA